jgi:hypothetical protein
MLSPRLTKYTLAGKLVKYDEVIKILGNRAESYVLTCDSGSLLILLQRTFIRPITYPIPLLPSHHCWRKAGRRQYSSLVYDCPYIV